MNIVNAAWYLYHTLPAQKAVLSVTHNNTQLFTLITKHLVAHLEDNQNKKHGNAMKPGFHATIATSYVYGIGKLQR